MATYREQVSPFFDFSRAGFRHNSEWLSEIRLPELIEILAQIPVSMSLQREDFRSRLGQGKGLAMSEFIYSVVTAIDSAKISANVELGGLDQLLNMQMGRKVMEVTGQQPQLVVAMPLIEGTDGTGRKMSKSLGNYIALSASPEEIFGKIMSIPDHLMLSYLRAWTEWTDAEIDLAAARVDTAALHPMELKKILAGEAAAAVHGVAAAMAARRAFTAQFSRRLLGEVETLPVLESAEHGAQSVGVLLTRVLEFTPSISAARRMARQQGLEQPGAGDMARHYDGAVRGMGAHFAWHAGQEPEPVGMGSPMVAPYGAYATADGHTAVLGTTSDREWRRMARDMLGRPDLADDPRYAHNADRVQHRAELDQLVGAWCAGLDLAEIQRRADEAGIGNARLNEVRDLAGHPQLARRSRWREVGSPAGPLPALLPPALARDWTAVTGSVPALGADTDAIRAEVNGYGSR